MLFPFAAPAGDEILTESDAVTILEELTEAQYSASLLGLMLNIKPVEVEAISKMYQDPMERLCQIILAWLRQVEPPPTWRAIVNALRSKTVNLTALAKRVEAAHFPDPTASRDPPTTSGESNSNVLQSLLYNNIYYISGEGVSSNTKDALPQSPAVPLSKTQSHLSIFGKNTFSFNYTQYTEYIWCNTAAAGSDGTLLPLATSTEEVKRMIAELENGFKNLRNTIRECLERQRVLPSQVADALTSLSPDDDEQHKIFAESHVTVLYQAANISEQFGTMNFHWNYLDPSLLEHLVKEFHLEQVKDWMEAYKSDLQQLRKKTPLMLFFQVQRRKRRPQEDFEKMVVEFDWPENVTLEDVEQFRREYASKYSLQECAMMIVQIRGDGSGEQPSFSLMEKCRFVEQPSEDFFCPVTCDLLLQPYLMSCCGTHISQEAVSKLKEGERACPLCANHQWNTVLNKHFRCQVKSLHVFCCYEDRGCEWQGELARYEEHISSCPNKNTKESLYQ